MGIWSKWIYQIESINHNSNMQSDPSGHTVQHNNCTENVIWRRLCQLPDEVPRHITQIKTKKPLQPAFKWLSQTWIYHFVGRINYHRLTRQKTNPVQTMSTIEEEWWKMQDAHCKWCKITSECGWRTWCETWILRNSLVAILGLSHRLLQVAPDRFSGKLAFWKK